MTEQAQIPRVSDVMAGGVKALLDVRPHAAQFLESGRYGDVFAIWKSQVQIALARLADECTAARVPLAEGLPLRDLLASEFDAVTDPTPQKAIGTFVIARNVIPGSISPAGLIRVGTRFRKSADATASPPCASAEYETVEPVFAPPCGPAPGIQPITVRVRALQPGTTGNIQVWQQSLVTLNGDVFDPRFAVSSARAAGGSDGVSIPKLRSLALAISAGQYGPTQLALVAGALLTNGISHVAVREYDDPGYAADRGLSVVWLCDDSWCWCQQLADTALQNLRNNWLGFGCKCKVNEVTNTVISAAVTVRLRNRLYLADTIEISDRIRAAFVSYFNDRADWWTWRERAIAARIVQCDRRILDVPGPGLGGGGSGVVISDAFGVLSEPTTTGLPTNPSSTLTHFEIDTTRLSLSFLPPD
ncbi:MAG: hypothetical protein HY898_22830 [Deltaproteobacteria bacterium]|nr:hypothetical protein [Deltaproteobacteria bacterium]